MARLTVGDIVIVAFPFSDLTGQKLRPAFVLAKAEFDNFILCQITSKAYSSKKAIKLTPSDFIQGKLPILSFIRPDKLFTADSSIIKKIQGRLSSKKRHAVLAVVQRMFKS